ncbi:helix-turn-helix domain-containing protein [Streptomyces sp. 8N616]|uniref:helix-turn-helix domain-containing protein n=1 Tax=Streptomyces sp. 8N616 TaxID=3457414 RepID=UPI003FD4B2B9
MKQHRISEFTMLPEDEEQGVQRMKHLVERAVITIRERFHEPIGLDDLARSAMVSKFYFLRVFRRITGVTPGRFLSAVRLHEAKRLLLDTSLNVANISTQVCYSSAGTFSRRFTASVGIAPTRYRRIAQGDDIEHPKTSQLPVSSGPLGSISGTMHVLGVPRSPLCIGAFDSPIMQGQPAALSMRTRAGSFSLNNVPPGTWYLHALAHDAQPSRESDSRSSLLVGTVGPVQVSANDHIRLDMAVKPEDWTRPPVLLALPGFDPLPAPAPSLAAAR